VFVSTLAIYFIQGYMLCFVWIKWE